MRTPWSMPITLKRVKSLVYLVLPNTLILFTVSEPRRTMKQELQRIGYLGSTPASYQAMPMAVSMIQTSFTLGQIS